MDRLKNENQYEQIPDEIKNKIPKEILELAHELEYIHKKEISDEGILMMKFVAFHGDLKRLDRMNVLDSDEIKFLWNLYK